MTLKFPWLITRILLLKGVVIDFFIIAIIKLQHFNNQSILFQNIYIIFNSLIWVITGYILGKYFNKKELLNNRYILKQFLISVILVLTLYLLKLVIDNYNFLYIDITNKSYLFFLIKISILSFLSQTISKKFLNLKIQKPLKWLFIGSEEFFINIKKISENDNLNSKFYFIDDISKIEYQKLNNNYSGVIVSDLNNLPPYTTNSLIRMKSNGIEIFNLISWSERFLERIPSSLLKNKDILSKEFIKTNSSMTFRIKRIIDILLSLIILFFSSPILIFSSILIKLEDRGPILYYQTRNGFNCKKFKIWKLRTMKVDAEKDGVKWAKKNDNRITRIGGILRLTRIDELPQLISVINGEMSLIGPRPERPEFDIILNEKINHYFVRYSIRPGLSGWAQVNYPYGASIEDSFNKLSYDFYYLRNSSLLLDLLIFFKTIKLVFTAKGATPN